MSEEDITSGASYAQMLLVKWQEVMDASEDFHDQLLLNNDSEDQPDNYDSEVGRVYITRLCRLWREVSPKVLTHGGKPKERFKEIAKEFGDFEPYINDPKKFFTVGSDGLSPKDADSKLFKLERILRYIMEELKITEF